MSAIVSFGDQTHTEGEIGDKIAVPNDSGDF
jgi:hypothetical protein